MDLLDPSIEFATARRLLEAELAADPGSAELRYALWEVCLACGDHVAARDHLDRAIAIDPLRSRPSGMAPSRVVLAIATPGDLQANLPLAFLFDERTELHTLFLADPARALADPASCLGPRFSSILPSIDVAFVSIAEDERHAAALSAADRLVDWLRLPAINSGAAIAASSRVRVSQRLAGLEDCIVPRQAVVSQKTLGSRPVFSPFIVRPLGSHAGRRLARIGNRRQCRRYLGQNADQPAFTVAPFVEYRGTDGLYRKFRVVFVDGRPHPLHLAIHDEWAVWYYNAPMSAHPDRLLEEARFLDDMALYLGPRAMGAVRRVGETIGLDFAGLDAGLMPDGRIVLFEVETGMIVSDGGRAQGTRPAAAILSALEDLIDRRSAAGVPPYSAPPGLPAAAPSLSLSACSRMNPAASR